MALAQLLQCCQIAGSLFRFRALGLAFCVPLKDSSNAGHSSFHTFVIRRNALFSIHSGIALVRSPRRESSTGSFSTGTGELRPRETHLMLLTLAHSGRILESERISQSECDCQYCRRKPEQAFTLRNPAPREA